MQYLEIKLTLIPSEPWKEIFTSTMADIGCDSFMDGKDPDELLCYMPAQDYDELRLREVVEHHGFPDVKVTYSVQSLPDKDWNAEWEANYTPVVIANRCYVRAPFHPARSDVEIEIIIEPKMSFGTAKHATTYQMAEYILETDMRGKSVLDMGSGTGVLAILAYMRGATPVTAIDVDEWAYRNSLENIQHNHCTEVRVLQGDATLLGSDRYDIILANINRNILLNDIPTSVNCLNAGGLLFLSGFYEGQDLESIKGCCLQQGLQYVSYKTKDEWVAAKFCKK